MIPFAVVPNSLICIAVKSSPLKSFSPSIIPLLLFFLSYVSIIGGLNCIFCQSDNPHYDFLTLLEMVLYSNKIKNEKLIREVWGPSIIFKLNGRFPKQYSPKGC